MNLRIDLRDTKVTELDGAVLSFPEHVFFLITAWQWSAWRSHGQKNDVSARLLVMVPDFLYYARLVSTGQAKTIPRLPASIPRLIKTGISCVPTGVTHLPGLARGRFWDAAEAMLAYDLGLLERSFSGEVILHYNLSDFAWSFERQSFLSAYKNKTKGRVGWGIATQQISAALSSCARWGLHPSRIMYTTGYSRPETLLIQTARRHHFNHTKWTVDMTQWPQQILCETEFHDFHRDSDSEWLVTKETGLMLIRQQGIQA